MHIDGLAARMSYAQQQVLQNKMLYIVAMSKHADPRRGLNNPEVCADDTVVNTTQNRHFGMNSVA